MADYRRMFVAGGCVFFTVMTHQRRTVLCHDDVRLALRRAIGQTRQRFPFDVDAWVLMPDHLHCIWRLPKGDADFATRWSMIKRLTSQQCRHLQQDEEKSESNRKRRENTLWQRRFWEHQIRDERDYVNHINYIHFNPVKHGYVTRVSDWPWSTFHRGVKEGLYPASWGDGFSAVDGMEVGDI